MNIVGRAFTVLACIAAASLHGCATTSQTDSLEGLISLAEKPCVVVDVDRTANCGSLGLQYGYDSATWLTVLSGDPSQINIGKLVVYGDDWAAWGTPAEVAPYIKAGGKTMELTR